MSRYREYLVPVLLGFGTILIGAAILVVAESQSEADLNRKFGRRPQLGPLYLSPYTAAMIGVLLTNSTGTRLLVIRGAGAAVAAYGAAILVRAGLGVRELGWGDDLMCRTLIPAPFGLLALVAYLTEPGPPKD